MADNSETPAPVNTPPPTVATTAPPAAPAEDAVAGEDEDDLEKLEAEIKRMEAEAAKMTQATEVLNQTAGGDGGAAANGGESSAQDPAQAGGNDAKSVYVGQVDYTTVPEELVSHFNACGTIERVTIVCDKFSGRPKGFAYLEFDVRVINTPQSRGHFFLSMA